MQSAVVDVMMRDEEQQLIYNDEYYKEENYNEIRIASRTLLSPRPSHPVVKPNT